MLLLRRVFRDRSGVAATANGFIQYQKSIRYTNLKNARILESIMPSA